MLAFQTDGANVTGLYFTGIHFHEASEAQAERDNAPEFVYTDTGITLDETTLMRDYKLDRNGVYTLTPEFIEKYSEMITKAENLANRTVQSSKGAILNKTDNQFRSLMAKKIAEAGNTYI